MISSHYPHSPSHSCFRQYDAERAHVRPLLRLDHTAVHQVLGHGAVVGESTIPSSVYERVVQWDDSHITVVACLVAQVRAVLHAVLIWGCIASSGLLSLGESIDNNKGKWVTSPEVADVAFDLPSPVR